MYTNTSAYSVRVSTEEVGMMTKRVPWAKRMPSVKVDQLLRTIAVDGSTKMLNELRGKPAVPVNKDAK